MTIDAGTQIGKYEIQSLLGVGGMGEVYRALDTELMRPVAIKFLSAEFALDPERMNRFVQEARAVSALNHPNILTIHEIGRAGEGEDASHFFVTELIDGVTLREHMERSKLKLGDVLDIAIQTASALVAAHAAGIIHRDIKPENIMVRPDGFVKVLDFGLAKPAAGQPSLDTEAATQMLVKTNPGTVMGTVNYMSPEQASGAETDARTDVWSLGVVLYEMLSGQTPFAGKTPSHTIVAILEKEPLPLSAFVESAPEALDWIFGETLAKDREERCQTARELVSKLKRLKQRVDVETELERSVAPMFLRSSGSNNIAVYPNEPSATSSANIAARTDEIGGRQTAVSSAEYIVNQVKKNKSRALTTIVFGLIAVSGIAFGIYKLSNRNAPAANQPSAQPTMKITRLTNNGKSSNPVVSPDGKYVAYVSEEAGKRSLLLRQVATTSFREIVPPFEGNFHGATFSPDGNDLYYVQGEKGENVSSLYRISTLGGEAQKLVHDVDSAITFSPDGKKLAFLRGYLKTKEQSLIVVSSDGGAEEQILTRKAPAYMLNPVWRPDGKAIAFAVSSSDDQGYFIHIDEVRLEDKAERKISSERWRSLTRFAWTADGGGLVMAARDRASPPGTPMQIWHVSYPNGEARKISNDLNEYGAMSLSADSRVMLAELRSVTSNVWVAPAADLNRAQQITPENAAGADGVAWTADGRIIYPSLERENIDLWIINADGSGKKQVTNNPNADLFPSVTADNRYIVFESNRGTGWGIWRINLDGSNPTEILGNVGRSNPRLSPDSRWIVYTTQASGNAQISKIPIDGGAPVQLTDKLAFGHAVSPDGKFIAYYTRSPEFNAPLQIEIISIEGGAPLKTFPAPINAGFLRWSPDNRALNYSQTQNGVSNIWSFAIDGKGQPKQLTDWKADRIFWFDWSNDGRSLAFSRGTIAMDLVLIENFK